MVALTVLLPVGSIGLMDGAACPDCSLDARVADFLIGCQLSGAVGNVSASVVEPPAAAFVEPRNRRHLCRCYVPVRGDVRHVVLRRELQLDPDLGLVG